MLKTITIQKILDTLDKEDYSGYKLCYVDDIPETYFDWSPESKEYISRPDFSWEKSHEKYGHNNPHLRTEEYPNPEFIVGKQEYYAWFTNTPTLDEQWGDDWDDVPYEHNAGCPYEEKGHDLIRVPFYVPRYLYCKFPCDYGFGGNSPFSVEDINNGAVPWIFAKKGKFQRAIKIDAGISPELFIQLINDISSWKE